MHGEMLYRQDESRRNETNPYLHLHVTVFSCRYEAGGRCASLYALHKGWPYLQLQLGSQSVTIQKTLCDRVTTPLNCQLPL